MMRYMLDTHVFVRWVFEPQRLSRQQIRFLRDAKDEFEQVGLATISLLEIAMLTAGRRPRLQARIDEILEMLQQHENVQMLPITPDVAREITAIGDGFGDPMDRAIVATARVNGLFLLTSDERIIESKLVPVID